MLGVKVKTVKTQKGYTINELYEAMKDKTFSAGVPSLTKHGLAYIVTFPALDRQNQVWVCSTALGNDKPSQKFTIQKGEAAGVGNMVGNQLLDDLTGGIFGWGKMVGKNSKRCEELVDLTAKEMEALNL